jgi:hypothetical protein
VVKREPGDAVEMVLRTYVEHVSPTSRFRRRAWREFQRALDPLALPKPLESTRMGRPRAAP